MDDSIEERIARILKRTPTVEDYLAPIRARIGVLQKQLAQAKTRPKRQAIGRELNKHLRHVSQAESRNQQKRPSVRRIKKEKAEMEKLGWLVRKTAKSRA